MEATLTCFVESERACRQARYDVYCSDDKSEGEIHSL